MQYDYTNVFRIIFGNFDEILFSTGGKNWW